MKNLLVTLLAFVVAAPAAAQLGYGPGGDFGMKIKIRPLDKDWKMWAGAGAEITLAGAPDSGEPVDGVALKHNVAKLTYQVLVAGEGWQEWKAAAEPAGTAGKHIEGIRIKSDHGSVRYRASFVNGGETDWVVDGAPIEKKGFALESLQVEFRKVAREGATFEYRAYFKGSGFTPWLQPGQAAESKRKDPEITALEVRAGGGIRYEVALSAHGWQTTALEGETAGDATGKFRIEAIRLFGGESPLRYRVKIEGEGWTPWVRDGTECGAVGRAKKLTALEIRPYRGEI